MTKITHDFYLTKRKRTIKGLLPLIVLLFMGNQMSWGQTALPFYDGLNYVTGTQLFSNAGWVFNPATTPVNDIPIVAGNLSYPGLQASTGGKIFLLAGGDDVIKQFTLTNSGKIYYSFLININSMSGAILGQAIGLVPSTVISAPATAPGSGSIGAPCWVKNSTNAGFFNISLSEKASKAAVFNTIDYPMNTPVFVVVSCEILAGLDVYKLWVNPTPGVSEPTATYTVTSTGDLVDFSGLFIKQNGSGSTPSMELDELRVGTTWADVTPVSTTNNTWNGANWSNGTPTSSQDVIINGTYSTNVNGAFVANALIVNSGFSLTINSGTSVTLSSGVLNNAGTGGVVIENNANLIQLNPAPNSGNVVVKRNSSALSLYDYTLWSSPVSGTQTLADFSPLTSQSPNRFYTYNSATNLYDNTSLIPTTATFAKGKGYLIRMPNTAVAAPAMEVFNGQFVGVLNNGDVPVTMPAAAVGFRFNLVGNPYSSPISMTQFVTDNTTNITGTLYFWRKTNGSGTAYCTWAAGIFTNNGNTQSVDPAGVIQAGQGFFVESKVSSASLVTFKSGQKIANTTGQFFKTKQVAASRVWLNATNAAGDFSQMAVNYTDGASQGVDDFDGKYFNDSAFALTSNINNEEYAIQGRPAFDASDVVALNFKTAAAGDYTIAIDHADGLFAADQDVYLVDSKTGTETNLKTSAYTFTAASGVDNARFSLKYQKTLKVNTSVLNDNSVTVYKNNGVIYINSGVSAINNIKVYDIQGRLIAEQNNVKANTATINNLKANQVLIVKVTSEDNKVVSKKVEN